MITIIERSFLKLITKELKESKKEGILQLKREKRKERISVPSDVIISHFSTVFQNPTKRSHSIYSDRSELRLNLEWTKVS